MTPEISSLDHLVLTVANIKSSVAFYRDMMGMQIERFSPSDGSTRWALKFGAQKINLHLSGAEFFPNATQATPGSADLCFLSKAPLEDWQAHFFANGLKIEQGPVKRTGASGPILSLYIRDPDGNLIEISNRI